MSTILFLDDMEVRHAAFREWAAEYGFVVDSAHSAEEAIKKLERHEYVAACLDHDLAEEHYAGPYASPSMGGTAHSGRAVARWIAAHGKPGHVARAGSQLHEAPMALVHRAPFGPIGCLVSR